jgi:MEDS: MEthanogen/methylotroph, DcmR Sensory domain
MQGRVVGDVSTARRRGCSEHACRAYTTRSERDAAAIEWLLEGVRLGQRLLAVAHDDDAGAGLLSAFADASSADVVQDVVYVSIDQFYDLSAPIDIDAQLSRYSNEVARALADGFTGLRVFCDITTLIADAARRPGHARWEHAADAWMAAGNPLAPLCAYDVGVLGDQALAVMALHPLRNGPGSAVTAFGLYCGSSRRVLDGEIDVFDAPVLAEALRALPDGPLDIDASELSFLCARGAVAVARAGQGETDHAALRLLGVRPAVRRVWEVLDLDPEMLPQPRDTDESVCA